MKARLAFPAEHFESSSNYYYCVYSSPISSHDVSMQAVLYLGILEIVALLLFCAHGEKT